MLLHATTLCESGTPAAGSCCCISSLALPAVRWWWPWLLLGRRRAAAPQQRCRPPLSSPTLLFSRLHTTASRLAWCLHPCPLMRSGVIFGCVSRCVHVLLYAGTLVAAAATERPATAASIARRAAVLHASPAHCYTPGLATHATPSPQLTAVQRAESSFGRRGNARSGRASCRTADITSTEPLRRHAKVRIFKSTDSVRRSLNHGQARAARLHLSLDKVALPVGEFLQKERANSAATQTAQASQTTCG